MDKLTSILKIRYGSTAPANLTRLSTKMMLAIHDSLVSLSLAFTRFSPYAVFACPNLPSIGLRSPGLTCFCTAEGLPRGLARSLIPFSFRAARNKFDLLTLPWDKSQIVDDIFQYNPSCGFLH